MAGARIAITGDDEAGLCNELAVWLTGNREFRGRVSRVARPVVDGQLGGIVDVLEVGLGSGGAGIVLAQSLAVWLRNQRADIAITMTRGDETVTVYAQRVADPEALLREILDAPDEPDATDEP